MIRRAVLAAALAVLAAPVAAPVMAQNLDLTQGGPVEITATDGIEWRQQEQVIVARGNARAVRDGVTVDADRLIARYRPRAGTTAQPGESPLSGGEIFRFEAEGNVRVTSATERAEGDRAVYDIDQAVMVMSGRNLSLTTPEQRITARDSLEYWPQRRMAVGRGGAVVTTSDNRRIAADTLVAYFLESPAPGAPTATPAPAPTPAPTTAASRPAAIPGLPGNTENSRIDRVEAYGSVEIRSPEEVVRGDRGVYSPPTGLARLMGGVRITRGDNQLNGTEAIVNLRTGVSRLVSAPGDRVQGLVVPQQQPAPGSVAPAQRPAARPTPAPVPAPPPPAPRPPQGATR
ncbi:LptA/OstA family protein [Falsiroseomonas stagni]|uniref:Lipopolysaccharide export system protein LptA n=1 Tax=Falsiroseomonas stagni DSM 19981 TaxID=1123062 RepID=A0A1I4EFA6_9PROT|nr:LptA/OstA family protein [Falsiroseomonas stagni]SFL04444.1 lipopolysaccharide export system protein LptA [Falsiroseomonas stagni DSM 19981]